MSTLDKLQEVIKNTYGAHRVECHNVGINYKYSSYTYNILYFASNSESVVLLSNSKLLRSTIPVLFMRDNEPVSKSLQPYTTVIQMFEQYKERLTELFGFIPSPETISLYETFLTLESFSTEDERANIDFNNLALIADSRIPDKDKLLFVKYALPGEAAESVSKEWLDELRKGSGIW